MLESIAEAFFVTLHFLCDFLDLMRYVLLRQRHIIHEKLRATSFSAKMELQGRIIVYSIVGCPHCMRAKNTLREHNLPYEDISVDMYKAEVRAQLKERTGKQTVPQIFFNNIHIGGNEELQKLVQNKEEFEKHIEDLKHNAPPEGSPGVPDPSLREEESKASFNCEPDEYASLVQALKDTSLIKDHRSGLKVHKNSFIGKEFVDWIVQTKQLSRDTAVEMGQHLIDNHFGHQVKNQNVFRDDKTYYRLLDDDSSNALNAGSVSDCLPRPAGDLGGEVRKLILKIYAAYLSPDGRKVNYEGIGKSGEFENYIRLTKELQRIQIQEATREEKLAFFINIYNALVIHANVVRGPPVNLWQRYKFFNTVKYLIGGYDYSLQDIENGVLRANRKGMGMLTKPFGKNDPRLSVALEKHEPLIHFALVCGAKSCPPIKTYSSEGIYEQLKTATQAFLDGDDGCQINMDRKEVKLSQILKWYREDFGEDNQQVLTWVHDHLVEGARKSQLGELLQSKNYKVSYMHYDWGINS